MGQGGMGRALTNAVLLVPVVVLVAVGVALAREHDVGELAAARGGLGLVALCTVEVAVEDARVALAAQQDQRVGERLEEALDRRLDCLTGLRVVIGHKGLKGVSEFRE